MRILISGLVIWIATTGTLLNAQSYVPEGAWTLSYAAEEDMHKMMFTVPDSNDAAVSFFCKPERGVISFVFVAPDVDIRIYKPRIRTESVAGDPRFNIEYNEVMGDYWIEQPYDTKSPFLQSLISGDDLLIDDARFRVVLPNDGLLFREFVRSCGGKS